MDGGEFFGGKELRGGAGRHLSEGEQGECDEA